MRHFHWSLPGSQPCSRARLTASSRQLLRCTSCQSLFISVLWPSSEWGGKSWTQGAYIESRARRRISSNANSRISRASCCVCALCHAIVAMMPRNRSISSAADNRNAIAPAGGGGNAGSRSHSIMSVMLFVFRLTLTDMTLPDQNFPWCRHSNAFTEHSHGFTPRPIYASARNAPRG